MTDKPEKEEKAEAPAAEKPKEKVAEKPAEKAAAKPAAAAESAGQEKKRRKISRMTAVEVDAQLKMAKEKMGDFKSSFARHLLARRSELQESVSKKK